MELIQENEAVSDSDRIYVFFTETATEFEFYDKLRVSRVAQLCKVRVWIPHLLLY